MQYLRIFATARAMRLAILATMTFIVLYALEAILLSVFSCTPIRRFWNRPISGTCVDFKALWFAHAAINIFSDVLIISLPMPVIKGLNIPTKQKLALMGIFALGALYVYPNTQPSFPPANHHATAAASPPSCASNRSTPSPTASTNPTTTSTPPSGPTSRSTSPSCAPRCPPSKP